MFNIIWNYEARILPILFALSIFGFMHLVRKLTKVEYTPSYFAIFPLSMLESQLAEYFQEEHYGNDYFSKNDGRPSDARLFTKSIVSFVSTFLLVPIITGFIVAFFLTENEFLTFLILLIVWEGWHCLKATYDFSAYRGNLKSTLSFFGFLYLAYLGALFFITRSGYSFARPYIEKGSISELFYSVENRVIPILVNIIIFSTLSGLFTHWLINKDALKPRYELDEENEEDKNSNGI